MASGKYEYQGKLMFVNEIAREAGINRYTLHSRLDDGWSLERALSEPVRSQCKLYPYHGEDLSLYEISERCGVPVKTLRYRLANDWSLEWATSVPPGEARPDGRQNTSSDFSASWNDSEWEHDEYAKRIVRENPGGLSEEEVGKYMGVSHQRVSQIERRALAKIRLYASYGIQEAIDFLEHWVDRANKAA